VNADPSGDDRRGEEEKVMTDIASEAKDLAVDSWGDGFIKVEEKLLAVIESILSCTPMVNMWNLERGPEA
jgi:hypothetical protein